MPRYLCRSAPGLTLCVTDFFTGLVTRLARTLATLDTLILPGVPTRDRSCPSITRNLEEYKYKYKYRQWIPHKLSAWMQGETYSSNPRTNSSRDMLGLDREKRGRCGGGGPSLSARAASERAPSQRGPQITGRGGVWSLFGLGAWSLSLLSDERRGRPRLE